MSLVSVYDIGMVTLTKGSPSVSGSGTAWVGAGLREGDMFWSEGLSVRILSAASSTSLTLAHPWPGTTGSGKAYEVHYKPDVERSFSTSITLLDRIKDTGLVDFTNLDKAPNDIPIFTGTDSMGTVATNETGRALLKQILFALSGSNIVTSSTTRIVGGAVQGTASETTLGKLLKVGSFGLGDSGPLLSDMGITTGIATGFYTVDATTAGKPSGVTTGTLLHFRRAATAEAQLLACDSGSLNGHLLFRTRNGGVWAAWKQITT